jgi:hypothetical protein
MTINLSVTWNKTKYKTINTTGSYCRLAHAVSGLPLTTEKKILVHLGLGLAFHVN